MSYKRIREEVQELVTVNPMKPISGEKSKRVFPTWGVVATLIKRQEIVLIESQQSRKQHDEPALNMRSIVEETIDNISGDDNSDDDTTNDEHDAFAPWLSNSDDENIDVLSLITIQGSANLQRKIRTLLGKYRSVFASTLSSEPATIPPFELKVDKSKWESHSNRGPPRVQKPAKEAEIFRQVDELLKAGIIEPSTASFYSQVILASKPDDSWRFCIDYRKLNDCTESASWPLPLIKGMFQRLGTHQSDTFGVMDLTAGYYQAPVGMFTRVFLAFICFCGIFQYTRLPFGPKRAPSYFQQMMSTVVLTGLLYFICEMYLDDCIVHAKGDDQFLERLEKILIRFKTHNIFLKPTKCKFGMPEVEYCGKEISKDGLTMSLKKVRKVLDFPKPETAAQMKQFVGLTNYFHDYVSHHAEIMHPLHAMIQNYQKKTRGRLLDWTPEGTEAFHKIIAEISKRHTMFFPRDDCPITMQTDSSDFGIGGYVFQTVDGIQQPVAFVSKSLNPTQLKWAIIQKEAFAIFWTFKQLRAILRDRHFTVETDHRNLLYIKTDSNPMIVRWYVDMQEFDYTLKDILGSANPIADGISRCVQNRMTQTQQVLATLIHIPDTIMILIGSVHNSLAGHHGVERTMYMLTTKIRGQPSSGQVRSPIPYLRTMVKQFIKTCPCCQKMSMIKVPINSHPFTTSSYTPMECLNIDFIGPFPDKGYIMVIIDTFTRWVELYLSPEATGEVAALNLYQHFGRFGAPKELRSDRGSHFANKTIAEFLRLVGVQHALTLSYSSEQNAIVEKVNKEINRHIRAFTFDSPNVNDYALALPIVQRIINSAYSDHTHINAASMLFGNALQLDRGIILNRTERPDSEEPLSVTASKMLSIQGDVMRKAANIFIIDDANHIALRAKTPTEFQPGSFVLVKYRGGTKPQRPPTRLHTAWQGPLQVISNTQSQYKLFDLIKNKEKDYHSTDLKVFNFDPLRVDPLDIARRDYLEFFVEKVLNITGDTQRLGSLSVHIKWLGYDNSYG